MKKSYWSKALSVLLSLAMLITVLPPTASFALEDPFESEYPQLIQNSGFEDGSIGSLPDHWSILEGSDTENGTAAASQDAGYVGSGSSSLKITYSGASTFAVISDPVAVEAGESYRLNLHSKKLSADKENFQAYVCFYDESGAEIAVSPALTAGGDGWKYITTNSSIPAVTAPDDAVSARYVISVGTQDESTTLIYYFDKAALYHLDSSVASVPNAGFEDGIDPDTGYPAYYDSWEWSDAGMGTVELSSEKTYRGSYSVKLSSINGSGTVSIRTALVSAQPGTSYDFSAYLYVEKGNKPTMRLIAFDQNGAQLLAKDIASTQSQQWEKVSATWETPVNTAYVSIMFFQSLNAASNSNIAYLDNFSVKATAEEDPTQPYVSNYLQLIQNSSFENGTVGSLPDHWSILEGSDEANGSAAVSQDAGYVRLGDKSLKLSYTGSSVFGIISDPVAVEAGETYRLNVHSKKLGTDSSKYCAYLNYYDEDGLFISSSPIYSNNESGDWKYVTTNTSSITAATAPAGAVSARYVLSLGQEGTSTSATFYLETATMTHLDDAVTAVPNAGFENGTDSNTLYPAYYDVWEWTDNSKGTQTLTAEKAYEGSYSLKLVSDNSTGGQNSIRSALVAAQANTSYNFTAYIFTQSGSQPVVRAFAFDQNGAQLGFKDLTVGQTSVWEKAKLTWTTPANTAYVSLMVYQNRTQASNIAYVDNLSIKKTSEDIEDIMNASLVNSGFEDGTQLSGLPKSWMIWPGNAQGKISIDTVTVHTGSGYNGTHSVKLVDDSTSDTAGIGSEPVQVVAGKLYRATAWIYNESGAGVALYMNFYKTKADAIANSGRLTPVLNYTCTAMGQWTLVTVEGTAPAGATCATVGFYQGQASEAVSYLDDVAFLQVPDTVYPDSLQNPNFEDGVSGSNISNWTKYDNSNIELSDEIVYEGDYSVKMTAQAMQGCGVRSDQVAVIPGVTYQATGMIYNKIGTSEIYLEFWNKSGRISVEIAGSSRTGQWQEVKAVGTAPAGATYATILVYQNSGVSGIVYADQMSFGTYTPVSEPVDHYTALSEGHPRVFFAGLADIRAKANDTTTNALDESGKKLADKILASADAYLAETSFTHTATAYGSSQSIVVQIPPVTQVVSPAQPSGYSNYPFWTAICRGLEDRMEILSMAYSITGEESYARKAVDIAVALAGWNAWHDPEDKADPTSLDTAHTVLGVAAVYDLCYDYMTPTERQTIQTALINLGLEPLYADAKEKVDHNIQALRTSALTTGALALMNDVSSDLTDKYLTRAVEYFQWYLEERAESGNQEGFGYTSYALENMVDAFDQLARVTGYDDLIQNDFLNNTLVNWIVSFSAPGSYDLAKVSDFDGGTGFYQTLYVLANNGNGLAGWYLANAKPGSTVLLMKQFLYSNDNFPITEPCEAISNSGIIDEVGWGAMRTGWEAGDTLLGLVSNNTGLGHNHYDQNSFLIATNGTWIADDPGYSTFDNNQVALKEFNGQVGHNTILVDWVKNSAQGAQVYKGGGSLAANILTSSYSYIIGSAPDSYGGNVLDKFDRHAIMINHGSHPYFVLFDDLSSTQARTYTWSLYTGGEWEKLTVDGSPVSGVTSSQTGNSIKVSKNNTSLYAQFIGNTPLTVDTDMYKSAEGPYIHVSNEEKASDYNFLTILNTYSDGYQIPATFFQSTAQISDGCSAVLTDGIALFRGETGVGSKVTYTFNVIEDGVYDLTIISPKSPAYGIYQASVDGTDAGAAYDGYNSAVTYGNEHSLGGMPLTAGSHTLTLTCEGKNDLSSKTLIGVTAIQLKNTAADGIDAPMNVSETIDTANALGAKIPYTADAYDLILFNRTDSAISESNVNTDAAQVSLVGVKADGSMEGIGMNNGTSLVYNGNTLLTSTAPVRLYADYNIRKLTVESDTSATITIRVNGAMVTRNVAAGSSEISLPAAVTPPSSQDPSDSDESSEGTTVKATDSSTRVSVKGEPGVLPADTTMTAFRITEGDVYNSVLKSLGDSVQQLVLFDISLFAKGKEIQPNGKVTVTIPIPGGLDQNRIALYHILDDGTAEKVNFTISKGKIIFTTDRFSKYAVAETKENTSSSGTENSSQNSSSNASSAPGSEIPNTGNPAGTPVILVLILSGAVAAEQLIRKNRRNTKTAD